MCGHETIWPTSSGSAKGLLLVGTKFESLTLVIWMTECVS